MNGSGESGNAAVCAFCGRGPPTTDSRIESDWTIAPVALVADAHVSRF